MGAVLIICYTTIQNKYKGISGKVIAKYFLCAKSYIKENLPLNIAQYITNQNLIAMIKKANGRFNDC